jgi:hypothetical protein
MKVSDLASQCALEGVASLRDDERDELRSLFLKEARKGAFRPGSGDSARIRAAFCAHVQREFGADVLTVIDCLPYFRRKASEQLSDPIPLASLMLYATWIEHWVNVLISIGTQRRGGTDTDVENYFRSRPRFKDKVAHLESLCSTRLPSKARGWLLQIMATRTRYHHYVWKGMPGMWVTKDLKGATALTKTGEEMINQLLAFEHTEFDAPLEHLASELFPAHR